MHRVRLAIVPFAFVTLSAATLSACDFSASLGEPTNRPSSETPLSATVTDTPREVPTQPSPASTWRYGVVSWYELEGDCPPSGAWEYDETGMVQVEGDTLTLVLETTPTLYGVIYNGESDIAGTATFMGDTGDDVTCQVAGSAAIDADAIQGEMSERLSSAFDLNCTSNARFIITLDP